MAEELVLMHDTGLLNDEELLLFDNANRKRNLMVRFPIGIMIVLF